MESYQIFLTPPVDFDMNLQAAACYCEYENKILFLKRPPGGRNGDTWSMPGGKLEKEESAIKAVIREIYEEVGFLINEKDLMQIGTFYIKIPELDYVFYTFRKVFLEKPEVVLNLEEHIEARWVTIEEALQLPLIRAGRDLLIYYRKQLTVGQT